MKDPFPDATPPISKIHAYRKVCPKLVQFSLFYERLRYFSLFGLDGAVKPGEEEDDPVTLLGSKI